MFENLSKKLSAVFDQLKGSGKLTEKNITEALRAVRLAFLEADIHVAVVKQFLERVKEKSLGAQVLASLNPGEQFLKIIQEELIHILEGAAVPFELKGPAPHAIFLVGLQGSGKTTTAAKLARFLKKKGKHPYLVPADVYRPAAIAQLQILAKQEGIPCFETRPNSNPVSLLDEARDKAAQSLTDVLLIDTAGRLQTDHTLMDELISMKQNFAEPMMLFVGDALTGQQALNVAKTFHQSLTLTGFIFTKLDGDAKGGALFSVHHTLGLPLFFVGMGEKMDALEPFHPDRLVSRLLDRGDIVSLLEKASEVIDQDEAKKMEKNLRKNNFTIEDMRAQLKQAKKMGGLGNILNFMPGMGKLKEKIDLEEAQKGLKKKEAIINSMTLKERYHHEIIDGNRRRRIALGSGTQVSDVNRFLKEFLELKKVFKNFSKQNMRRFTGF